MSSATSSAIGGAPAIHTVISPRPSRARNRPSSRSVGTVGTTGVTTTPNQERASARTSSARYTARGASPPDTRPTCRKDPRTRRGLGLYQLGSYGLPGNALSGESTRQALVEVIAVWSPVRVVLWPDVDRHFFAELIAHLFSPFGATWVRAASYCAQKSAGGGAAVRYGFDVGDVGRGRPMAPSR